MVNDLTENKTYINLKTLKKAAEERSI